eukprot:scaffold5640_cov182-Ochromonas_danica.AAC.4
MSSRSLLLQLPRDILHSVYSEWLSSWRDLSCLDVGCVGKGDREAWLCSLSEVRIISVNRLEGLSEESMRRWYEWVISRKVLVAEMFSVSLTAFANLTTELDFGSYCSYIRSILIQNDLDTTEYSLDSSLLSVLEDRWNLFECVCLKEVSIDCGVNSDVRDLLPRDILHSVYSEWLSSWRDLSCLDVGCVGKGDREAWLCSLREVKMKEEFNYGMLYEESMRMWYEWIINRKVLMIS